MVYVVYIAAAALIGLLIGFVALSIGWLSKSVMHNVRSKTIGLLSIYDELLEKKSRELRYLKEAEMYDGLQMQSVEKKSSDLTEFEASKEAAKAVTGIAERAGTTVYREGNIPGIYRKIRQNFAFDAEDLVQDLSAFGSAEKGPAAKLLEELNWNTFYRLSTLPSGDQVSVLEDVLEGDSRSLLEDYLNTGKVFSALDFYDYLRAREDAEPRLPIIRMSPSEAAELPFCKGVTIVPDDEICEGFQVEVNHYLYDYSLRERELR